MTRQVAACGYVSRSTMPRRVQRPAQPVPDGVAGGNSSRNARISTGSSMRSVSAADERPAAPRYLRVGQNGPEFVAAAILRWLAVAGIDTAACACVGAVAHKWKVCGTFVCP